MSHNIGARLKRLEAMVPRSSGELTVRINRPDSDPPHVWVVTVPDGGGERQEVPDGTGS